jgi:hypothetical protein
MELLNRFKNADPVFRQMTRNTKNPQMGLMNHANKGRTEQECEFLVLKEWPDWEGRVTVASNTTDKVLHRLPARY